MASWREVRPGRQYVNLSWVGNRKVQDTIESISVGQIKGKPQLVALLKKNEMFCNLNSNSCQLLEKKWGEDYENWVGKKVIITVEMVKFSNGQVKAIMVKPDGK